MLTDGGEGEWYDSGTGIKDVIRVRAHLQQILQRITTGTNTHSRPAGTLLRKRNSQTRFSNREDDLRQKKQDSSDFS